MASSWLFVLLLGIVQVLDVQGQVLFIRHVASGYCLGIEDGIGKVSVCEYASLNSSQHFRRGFLSNNLFTFETVTDGLCMGVEGSNEFNLAQNGGQVIGGICEDFSKIPLWQDDRGNSIKFVEGVKRCLYCDPAVNKHVTIQDCLGDLENDLSQEMDRLRRKQEWELVESVPVVLRIANATDDDQCLVSNKLDSDGALIVGSCRDDESEWYHIGGFLKASQFKTSFGCLQVNTPDINQEFLGLANCSVTNQYQRFTISEEGKLIAYVEDEEFLDALCAFVDYGTNGIPKIRFNAEVCVDSTPHPSLSPTVEVTSTSEPTFEPTWGYDNYRHLQTGLLNRITLSASFPNLPQISIDGSCSDNVENGLELGIDCGTEACGIECPPFSSCIVDEDCTSGSCDAGKCTGGRVRSMIAGFFLLLSFAVGLLLYCCISYNYASVRSKKDEKKRLSMNLESALSQLEKGVSQKNSSDFKRIRGIVENAMLRVEIARRVIQSTTRPVEYQLPVEKIRAALWTTIYVSFQLVIALNEYGAKTNFDGANVENLSQVEHLSKVLIESAAFFEAFFLGDFERFYMDFAGTRNRLKAGKDYAFDDIESQRKSAKSKRKSQQIEAMDKDVQSQLKVLKKACDDCSKELGSTLYPQKEPNTKDMKQEVIYNAAFEKLLTEYGLKAINMMDRIPAAKSDDVLKQWFAGEAHNQEDNPMVEDMAARPSSRFENHKLFYSVIMILMGLIFVTFAFKPVGNRSKSGMHSAGGRFGFGNTILPLPPQYELEQSTAQRIYIPFVFGIMHNVLFLLGLIPLTFCRWTWTKIPEVLEKFHYGRKLVKEIPIADLPYLHQLCGWLILIGLATAGTLWLTVIWIDCLGPRPQACLAFEPANANFSDPKQNVAILRVIVLSLWFTLIPMIVTRNQMPGVMLKIFAAFPAAAQPYLNRWQCLWWEFCWWAHVLAASIVLVVALYARFEIFFVVLPSWGLYAFDKLIQFVFLTRRVEIPLAGERRGHQNTRLFSFEGAVKMEQAGGRTRVVPVVKTMTLKANDANAPNAMVMDQRGPANDVNEVQQPTFFSRIWNSFLSKFILPEDGHGRWYYVNCHELSGVEKWQWHPFSLASHSQTDPEFIMDIHYQKNPQTGAHYELVKTDGCSGYVPQRPELASWTFRLARGLNLINPQGENQNRNVRLNIRGPFGNSFRSCLVRSFGNGNDEDQHTQGSIILGSGVGVSAALGVFREFLHKKIQQDPGLPQFLWFGCVLSNVENITWFWDSFADSLVTGIRDGAFPDVDVFDNRATMVGWLSVTFFISRGGDQRRDDRLRYFTDRVMEKTKEKLILEGGLNDAQATKVEKWLKAQFLFSKIDGFQSIKHGDDEVRSTILLNDFLRGCRRTLFMHGLPPKISVGYCGNPQIATKLRHATQSVGGKISVFSEAV